MTTTSATIIQNIVHEDLVIRRLVPSDLHATRAAAEALGGEFVGVLQQTGLGTPSYFAGIRESGTAYNRVVLSYESDGASFERIWNHSRETNGTVTYKLRNDNSSHGFVSVAE